MPTFTYHSSSRKYLRFAFKSKVYQFQVLPFGLNTAPPVFTQLGHTVTGYLHRQGISVIPYLDDWLIYHPESEAWEIGACPFHLSSLRVLTYSQLSQLMGSLNWASGLIPLGRLYLRPLQRHFHSLGLTPVYATASIRPTGPCQPSAALAGPKFSYLRNLYPHVSGGLHDFYGRLHAGVGSSHGGFPDFRYLDPYRP